jgi:aspartate beta-hydroxylase
MSEVNDVAALSDAALSALREGNPARACALLEQCVLADSSDGTTFFHLARARAAMDDMAGALEADERAIKLQPENALARLHYAAGLERQQQTSRALLHFMRALKDAQSRGEWEHQSTTPPPLRPLVEHAVERVRAGRLAALGLILDPLTERYGRGALERIYTAVKIYVGALKATYPDPRQRPNFFYIPGLRPSAYFDRRLFSWISDYEACTHEIQRELEALLPTPAGREPVFGDAALESENLRGYGSAPSWNGYYFYRHGERRENNCTACPLTARTLDALPLARIRGHGPEVLHSVFTPGTHLLPHRGVTNARSVSHLPLIVPEDCALRVGGEERAWVVGRAVIFDDTYEHEAWNRSSRLRVVLIADVWNPHLSEVERAAVTDVITTIGDDDAALGEL